MTRKQTLHGGSYRRLFSQARMAEDLIRRYVAPPWIDRLDISTLETVPAHFVSEGLEQRKSDVIRRLRYSPKGRALTNLVALACLLVCLAGCDHHHSEDHGDHASGHESRSSELQLTLDDGKKWPVDEHTRASAARIQKLVGEAEPLASVADARALGERLDEELDSLVKGCTMTGQAHDQLHVFLVALFPKVEALRTSTDLEDLRIARADVDSLLAAYESHFE